MFPDDDKVRWIETISDPARGNWEDDVIERLDMERAILGLPTMQRIAVQKWMRDERLTASERMNLTRAKKRLRETLQSA